MRHQQQYRLEDLVKSLNYYLFKVELLGWFGHSDFNLLSEKDEEKLKPLQGLQFSVARTLGIGHFDQDGNDLIDETYADVLFE